MKTTCSNILAAVLATAPVWASPVAAQQTSADWAAPDLPAGQVMAPTEEQRAAETAAIESSNDAVIRRSLEAARKSGRPHLERVLERLLVDGSRSEKAAFQASVGRTFSPPERLQASAAFQPTFDRGIDCRATRCIRSGNEKVCVNRSVCRVVCSVGAGVVGGAIGGGVGGGVGVGAGMICNKVCEEVPECTTINVCYEYERKGPGCF